jgi:hypothetical protein
MKRVLATFGVVFAFAVTVGVTTASADRAVFAPGATVYQGFECQIGLPTPDNQGVLLTTTTSITVVTESGVAVNHCTFTGTGYSPPDSSFPFFCNVQGAPADLTELNISPSGVVSTTCVVTPAL